jgi:hypothetical protein
MLSRTKVPWSEIPYTGFAHWQAIKAQELFAHQVMPDFRPTEAEERQSQVAGR